MSTPSQTQIDYDYSLNEIAINSYKIEINKEIIENKTHEIKEYVKVSHDIAINTPIINKPIINRFSCKDE